MFDIAFRPCVHYWFAIGRLQKDIPNPILGRGHAAGDILVRFQPSALLKIRHRVSDGFSEISVLDTENFPSFRGVISEHNIFWKVWISLEGDTGVEKLRMKLIDQVSWK